MKSTTLPTNLIHYLLRRRAFLLILLVLACIGLPPTVQAVSPAPDGGYGNGNTAEGTDALLHLTTGIWNSAFGYRALYENVTGIRNTAMGYQALYNNNGLLSVSGDDNVAIGAGALYGNTTGRNNIAIGSNALYYNTTGSNNILIGRLYGAPGFGHVTTDSGLTIIGNTYYASPSLVNIGGVMVDSHHDYRIPQVSIKAVNSIGIGAYSVVGDEQTGLVSIGGYNVTINSRLLYAPAVYDNAIAGSPVVVNSQGQLGVATSSARFKDEIKPMDKDSEAILALKPVAFRYNKEVDATHIPQFGLLAEDVEKVNPDLVTRDRDGKPYTVRYDAVNAMLLNEFLKAHRKMEEQEATIAHLKSTVARQENTATQQQKQIEALTAGLQKVSAQVEMGRPAPQTVLNSP